MAKSYLEVEREVLEYIDKHPRVTWRRVLREFPENPTEVSLVVRSLHHEGRIEKEPIFNYDSRLCFTSAGYRHLEKSREWFRKREAEAKLLQQTELYAEELRRGREAMAKPKERKKLFHKLRKKKDPVEIMFNLIWAVCSLGGVCCGIFLVWSLIHALA